MKLTVALEKAGVADRVHVGLTQLVGAERAQEIWDSLAANWCFAVNRRATSRAGACRYPSWKHPLGEIQINQILLKGHLRDERNNTILHEVAHAVNPLIYDKQDGHGWQWKRIMRAFGCAPNRTCGAEVSAELNDLRKQRAKHVYSCQRCNYKYYKIRKLKRRYLHRGCGGEFVLETTRG